MLLKPEQKPSPLIDPKLLRTLPIGSRMYIIGNIVRDFLEYRGSKELLLAGVNSLVGQEKAAPANKKVNLITKPTEVAPKAPDLTQSSVSHQIKTTIDNFATDYVEDIKKYIGNDLNPINTFFNTVQGDVLKPGQIRQPLAENKFQEMIKMTLSILADTYGIDYTDIWKADIELIDKGIDVFHRYIASEGAEMFDPGKLSHLFSTFDDKTNWKRIRNTVNRFEKGGFDLISQAVEAIERLVKPLASMGEGHSMNDQRWLLDNSKPNFYNDAPIGSIIDSGEILDKNDPAMLRNIKVKAKNVENAFENLWLTTNNAFGDFPTPFDDFLFTPNSGKMSMQDMYLYPSFEQLSNIFADMGHDITQLLKENKLTDLNKSGADVLAQIKEALNNNNQGNKQFLEGMSDLFEALMLRDNQGNFTVKDRPNKIQKAFQKMLGSVNKNIDQMPNFGYQMINKVARPADRGFVLNRTKQFEKLDSKQKAVLFLERILHDGSVNNNFKNVERILESIIAEDPLDVNYLSSEAMNNDLLKADYNDKLSLKAWVNDAIIEPAKKNQKIIAHALPEFDFMYQPTKNQVSKLKETFADLPQNLKALINRHAENLGVNFLTDVENARVIKEEILKQDPALFDTFNKYYYEKTGETIFKFKPNNWQDLTNVVVYREVQRYLNSNPNLNKTLFTDEVIRKGITYAGTIDENSELFSLLENIRQESPNFVAGLEYKIASVAEDAQDAAKLTFEGLNSIDAKYMTALMNKKYNVASYGQMLLAAQEVLGQDATLYKLMNNPNYPQIGAFSIEHMGEYLALTGGQLIGRGYPNQLVGNLDIEGQSFKYSELKDIGPADKYTIHGLIDELMMNEVNVPGNIQYAVIEDLKFATLSREEILARLNNDLLSVLNGKSYELSEFVEKVVSANGDVMPKIVQSYFEKNMNFVKHPGMMNHPYQAGRPVELLKFPTERGRSYDNLDTIIHATTMLELPDGTPISNKLPGMTVTYTSPLSTSKNEIKAQSFLNHIFASAAKEINNEFGQTEIAKALLSVEGGEIDDWKYFDNDVLQELKKILITDIDRFNGEGILFTTATGLESPTVSTKSTLRTATFDTLGLSVLEGAGTRGEMMLVRDDMKGLDHSKWVTVSRNNAKRNSITFIPGQGEQILTGNLQSFQDPVANPWVLNPNSPVQPALATKLKDIDELSPLVYGWGLNNGGGVVVHPVNGKYQIGDYASGLNNQLKKPKGPTQLNIDLVPNGVGMETINQYLKSKGGFEDIEEVIKQKNYIIQTMQEAAKNVSKNIDNIDNAHKAVAYIRTDELLKYVEDNRLFVRGRVNHGMTNIYEIADSLGKNGWKIPAELIVTDGSDASALADKLAQEAKLDRRLLMEELPTFRFNPNNNAGLLQNGNHRVQALKLWGIDYTPVVFEIDNAVVQSPTSGTFTPLAGIGTASDVTARTTGGTRLTSSAQDARVNRLGMWKKLAKYINSAEINKSMLNPISTVSDYLLNPHVGEFLTYTQTYREALQSAQAETIFKETNYDVKQLMKSMAADPDFVDNAYDSLSTMEGMMFKMQEWINKYGSAEQKTAIAKAIKYHPKAKDFVALNNSFQRGNYDVDIFDITSENLGISKKDYVNLFNKDIDFDLLTTSVGDGEVRTSTDVTNLITGEGTQRFYTPVQTIEQPELTTKGKLKNEQFIPSQHSLYAREEGMAKNFVNSNIDLLGPGNIRTLEEGVDYLSVQPQKLEIVGVNGARTIHSSTFDDLLQNNVDAGLMTAEDALNYKTAQNKSYVEKLFANARKQGKHHVERLQANFNAQMRHLQSILPTLNDVKIEMKASIPALELKALGATKAGKVGITAAKVGGVLLDAALTPAELYTLYASTIKYYDDPDFGAATGLGKYGIGPKEIFRTLLHGDEDTKKDFRNHNILTALAKGALNGVAWASTNTVFRNLKDNPDEFDPIFAPQDYDPETMGKNLGQFYTGFEFNPKVFLVNPDGYGGDIKVFKEKEKQPFISDTIYSLVKGTTKANRKYLPREFDSNKFNKVIYPFINSMFNTSANMGEENG